MKVTFTMGKRLHESASGFDRIDRAAGIIYGVKVIQPDSRNGRKYLREAISEAKPMYEGAKVFIDHTPPKGGSERPVRERWGQLQSVREAAGGGLDADLHYLKAHPMTEQLLESIERFRDSGLSHDAFGDVRDEGGVEVVHKINKVLSVDFVDRPATNKNLFESEGRTSMTKKKVLAVLRASKVPAVALFCKRISEMADMAGPLDGMEIETPDGEGAEGTEAHEGDEVSTAIKAAINSILDMSDLSPDQKLAKIKLLLNVEEQLNSNEGDLAVSESLKQELQASRAETKALREEVNTMKADRKREADIASAKKLLESMNREATDVRVQAILGCKDEAAQKQLIEQFAERGSKQKPNLPASSRMQESGSAVVPKDADEFKKRLGY